MTTSELHEAVQEEVTRFTPRAVPDFAAVLSAHKRARRRRAAASVTAVVVAVCAVGLVGVAVTRGAADPQDVVAGASSASGASSAAPVRTDAPFPPLDAEPLTGVSICRTAPVGRCWTFPAERARGLARLFQQDVAAGEEARDCLATGSVYRLSFLPPATATTAVDVPECGPVVIDGAPFTVGDVPRQAVKTLYRSAATEAAPTSRDTCAVVAVTVRGERVHVSRDASVSVSLGLGEQVTLLGSGVCASDVSGTVQAPGVLDPEDTPPHTFRAVAPGTADLVVFGSGCAVAPGETPRSDCRGGFFVRGRVLVTVTP